jgi:hypothetical protein
MPPLLKPAAVRAATIAWLIALAGFAGTASAASPAPVVLGGASDFAVLGATTVTSAGVSTVTGDVGVSPGTAVTGFGPGIVTGSIHAGDPAAATAHADLQTAYDDAAGRSPAEPAIGVLDGLTLHPGVHASGAALSLAGTLTLDADGDPNAVFVLQAGSTLITAAGSQVLLAGGAQACNVFWQVGSSATLGAGSLLRGSVLAYASSAVGDGATIHGRMLALTGAVTLDNDTISVAQCSTTPAVLLEPTFGDFSATTLNGSAQSAHATISDWSVDDPRAGALGWDVTMSASPLISAGSTPVTMTGATLTVAAPTVTAIGTNDSTAPTAHGGDIRAGSVVVADADAGDGRGAWSLAHGATDLTLRIPAAARAGSYTTTITTTLTPRVAGP